MFLLTFCLLDGEGRAMQASKAGKASNYVDALVLAMTTEQPLLKRKVVGA